MSNPEPLDNQTTTHYSMCSIITYPARCPVKQTSRRISNVGHKVMPNII